jgi:hypothetical protein
MIFYFVVEICTATAKGMNDPVQENSHVIEIMTFTHGLEHELGRLY